MPAPVTITYQPGQTVLILCSEESEGRDWAQSAGIPAGACWVVTDSVSAAGLVTDHVVLLASADQAMADAAAATVQSMEDLNAQLLDQQGENAPQAVVPAVTEGPAGQ